MNNRLKVELEHIEIPSELHERSKIGIQKAKHEMRPKKIRPWSKIASVAASIIILLVSYYVYQNYNDSNSQVAPIRTVEKAETIRSEVLYILYNDANQLEKGADLIIIGSPTENFVNREHISTYFDDGNIQDFYTLTNIKTNKILKSPEDFELPPEQIIKIIEPIGYAKSDMKEQKITREDYFELQHGKEYIIFLKRNNQGQYAVINLNNGKFKIKDIDKENINELDLTFKTEAEKVEHENFKKAVFEKFNIN